MLLVVCGSGGAAATAPAAAAAALPRPGTEFTTSTFGVTAILGLCNPNHRLSTTYHHHHSQLFHHRSFVHRHISETRSTACSHSSILQFNRPRALLYGDISTKILQNLFLFFQTMCVCLCLLSKVCVCVLLVFESFSHQKKYPVICFFSNLSLFTHSRSRV